MAVRDCCAALLRLWTGVLAPEGALMFEQDCLAPLALVALSLCHTGGLDSVYAQLQGRGRAGSWLPSFLTLGISHPDQHFPLFTLEDSDFPEQ